MDIPDWYNRVLAPEDSLPPEVVERFWGAVAEGVQKGLSPTAAEQAAHHRVIEPHLKSRGYEVRTTSVGSQ